MPPNVTRSWVMMLGIERDQNFDIAGSDSSIGAVRLVDTRIRQTYIVEDRLSSSLRDLFTENCFDLVAEPGCFFHAQAGSSADMQFH